MSTFTPFQQGNILDRYPYDRRTHNGVCVALCDYWLAQIRRNSRQTVVERLRCLEAVFPQVMQHQIRYGELRHDTNREAARRQVGADVGLDYNTDHTVVTRAYTGLAGVMAKIKSDLAYIGTAATWSLHFAPRFVDGKIVREGHAIAGFCNAVRRYKAIETRIHLFDPNLGEYVGSLNETEEMLVDMFSRIRQYGTVEQVHRTTDY